MKTFRRITAFVSVLAMMLTLGTVTAFASSGNPSTYASQYISATSWSVSHSTGTTFVVSYAVIAKDYFADVGATKVQIFRSSDGANWTLMRTYNHTLVSGMMAHNVMNHTYDIEYEGVANYYYRAKVFFWVGDGTNGEERAVYTTTVGLPVNTP